VVPVGFARLGGLDPEAEGEFGFAHGQVFGNEQGVLAFGIDAWWEEKGNANEEREILLSLQEEFTWYAERLQFRADRHLLIVEGVSKVLAAGNDGYPWADVAEMDEAFGRVMRVGTWDPGSGARDALIASGRLERLSDPDLRAALSSWGSVVDEVRDGESEMRTVVREAIVPLAASFGAPLGRMRSSGWPAPGMSDEEAQRVYAVLFAAPEFRSLVEFRLWWELGSGGEYDDAIAAVEEILSMVSEELASR